MPEKKTAQCHFVPVFLLISNPLNNFTFRPFEGQIEHWWQCNRLWHRSDNVCNFSQFVTNITLQIMIYIHRKIGVVILERQKEIYVAQWD